MEILCWLGSYCQLYCSRSNGKAQYQVCPHSTLFYKCSLSCWHPFQEWSHKIQYLYVLQYWSSSCFFWQLSTCFSQQRLCIPNVLIGRGYCPISTFALYLNSWTQGNPTLQEWNLTITANAICTCCNPPLYRQKILLRFCNSEHERAVVHSSPEEHLYNRCQLVCPFQQHSFTIRAPEENLVQVYA